MSDATLLEEVRRIAHTSPPEALATDEAFWGRFADCYERDDRFIQLNFGFYHPSLRPVLEAEIASMRELNRRGSHFKGLESPALLEAARADLARMSGVDPEEIAITRSASEAMNIVIQGFPLSPGDEVVCSDQDYGAMHEAWEQRARLDGVVLRQAALPLDPADDDEIVRLFESQLTPRTRLVFVTHLIHLTGQVLPAAKLCALAQRRGIPVLVDAAHSFAHVDFSIRDLGCDFLGVSLHKWLGAPLGTGALWVRRDRIAGLRPLFGDTRHRPDDIRRLERFGNRPDSAYAGLREAIRWHEALGTPVKQARLAHLHRLWANPLRTWPKFQVLTPRAPGRYGAIGLFTLEGVGGEALAGYLLKEHRIYTVPMQVRGINALRITPGLATSRDHIERLLEALQAAERTLT